MQKKRKNGGEAGGAGKDFSFLMFRYLPPQNLLYP